MTIERIDQTLFPSLNRFGQAFLLAVLNMHTPAQEAALPALAPTYWLALYEVETYEDLLSAVTARAQAFLEDAAAAVWDEEQQKQGLADKHSEFLEGHAILIPLKEDDFFAEEIDQKRGQESIPFSQCHNPTVHCQTEDDATLKMYVTCEEGVYGLGLVLPWADYDPEQLSYQLYIPPESPYQATNHDPSEGGLPDSVMIFTGDDK